MKFLITLATALSLTALSATAEEVELAGLKSKTPDSWKFSEPTSKMRLYQAQLPKAKGDSEDADLTIFYFGPGGGGGVKDNLERWKKQVEAQAGKTVDDISKVTEFEVGKAKVTYLDIPNATYLFKSQPFNRDAKAEKKADFHVIGVILEAEKGPFFMRLTGPVKTVDSHKKEFDEWLKNFKP